MTNVFVPALDPFLVGELETLDDIDDVRLHPLLDVDSLIGTDEVDFDQLLDRARRELADFDGSVDAIIAHWDFPTSLLVPLLCHEHGIPAPSIRSMVLCEHKYASRLAQSAAAPECVPQFAVFDPDDPDALDGIDLEFPFFVKPVKGHSSQLSFLVEDAEEFTEAARALRDGIGSVADAFDAAMRHADLPPEVAAVSARMGLAEQVVDGVQAAPEGSISRGEFQVHGIVDQPKTGSDGGTFDRIDYPSTLPDAVQERMTDVAERILREVGFDNGCFNVEFMWDEDADALWVIEVNTRLSQSHSDLFAKVDGRSNHKIALDVALGRRPVLVPGRGRFDAASKIEVGRDRDGVVRAVPGDDAIARLRSEWPETEVRIQVHTGDRLSELPHQEPGHYTLAEVYLGVEDRDRLDEGADRCRELLSFEIDEMEQA